MGKCDVCGKEVAMPFKCAFCGGLYCGDHRLPESHNCTQLIQTGKRRIIYREAEAPTTIDEAATRNSKAKKSSSSLKTVLLILLIGSFTLNLYLWNYRYSEGFEAGYSEGSTAGLQQGFDEGNSSGYLIGHEKGYDEGHSMGYESGQNLGFESGFERGNETGYVSGYNDGKNDGYDEGFKVGFNQGNETGYESGLDAGYLQGVEEGAGRGYTIRDPTFKEVKQFLRTDRTDSMKYDPQDFVCHDFSAMFKTNAFKAGYQCYYVSIRYPVGAHAIVGFNTTDKGFIFIEPQYDDIVSVEIGKPYVDRSKYVAPDYDDTIDDYTIIP